jgi:hypothetical protein
MSSHILLGLVGLTIAAVGACSAHHGNGESGQSSTAEGGAGGQVTSTGDAGAGDAGADSSDGAPTRVPCTSEFGDALTATHGRLDGLLVSIVPPEAGPACNADTAHVHLQVQMNGGIYDVAVNTDTLYDEIDTPLPVGPWAEGWHPLDSLDYPGSLGVHSSSFTPTTPTALAQMIESELAGVNQISVFATGYGPTGVHDVHREGTNVDGAIAINPLDAKAHLLLFCFSTDSF